MKIDLIIKVIWDLGGNFMKTLIIYGTKYGSVEKCSEMLKNKLNGEVTVVNIKKDKLPSMNSFDNVIIGGSIYAGNIQKEIKEFCLKNIVELKEKKLGLFICGMSEGEAGEKQMNNSFPEELLKRAIIKKCFGGEFIFNKMNFIERFIIKKMSKSDKDKSTISKEKINEFVQIINSIN